MATESLSSNSIGEAQTFFWNLYREMRGGPLEDELETSKKILEVNTLLAQLTEGGKQNEDGSLEAQYVAFVETAKLSVDEGDVHIADHPDRIMKSTIRYAEDGFMVNGCQDRLKWLAHFELEGVAQPDIFSTLTGQVGHVSEEDGSFDYEEEHARGLVVAANNFGEVFNPDVFIQREY